MASFDIGRLCAIVKILDKASTHLRVAAVECAASRECVVAGGVPAGAGVAGAGVAGAGLAGAATDGAAVGGSATVVPPQGPDPAATGIDVLLKVSEHASGGVRRALLHIHNGEAQRAQHELDAARAETSGAAFVPAGLPRPLPPRVATALRLMLGITGFFPSETEQVLVRAAVQ
ncbi:hypothetical protein GKQ77_19510 [Streptomyces sp. BG9H]|uniref:Uncharacterized protein n=1 Tax=Streptomyces anatolicus TaxID=2675858 RepID=A0ABS6YQM2_9ACTN|nr:hypothetical protein [Streptomyces anatolicus]MBW5423723.1 hypothetical protein [Streptomyces anatolicus]